MVSKQDPRDRPAFSPALKVRAAMTASTIDSLFIMMLRNKTIRAHARRQLVPEHFSRAGEERYALLLRVLFALHDERPALEEIPYLDLALAVEEAVVLAGPLLTPMDREELLGVPDPGLPRKEQERAGLLWWSYMQPNKPSFSEAKGLALLKRFCEERGIFGAIKSVVALAGGGVIEGWREELQRIQDLAARVDTITARPYRSLRRPELDAPLIALTPIGVEFLDAMLDGGAADGELYGVLGGTGRGKSTLGSWTAVRFARSQIGRAAGGGPVPRAAVIVSYEDHYDRIWTRLVAAAARIPKKRLTAHGQLSKHLTRRGKLAPYEHALADEAGVPRDRFPGEYDRLEEAMHSLEGKILIIDMTTSGCGGGGVDEARAQIERDCEQAGIAPGLLILDSIDEMTMQYLVEVGHRDPDKAIHGEIPRMVSRIRKEICGRFGIPGLLTNQLAGDKLSRGVSYAPTLADAGLAKNWAKALDAAFTMGALNDDQVCQFHCAKMRRAEGARSRLIRLDGDYGRWLDAAADYTLVGNQILARDAAEVIAGPTVAPRPARPTKAESFHTQF